MSRRADLPVIAATYRRIEQAAAQFPDAVAVLLRGQQITYRELNERANRLACRIRGVTPVGSMVVLFVEDNIDHLVANLAIQKSGCVRVSPEGRLPPAALSAILKQIKAGLFLTDAGRLSRTTEMAGNTPILVVADAVRSAGAPAESENLEDEYPLEDFYALGFTSGTTGMPKGVASRRIRSAINSRSVVADLGLTSEDRLLIFGSLNFGASNLVIQAALTTGATIHLLDLGQETPESVFQWMRDQRVSVLSTVSSFFRTLFSPPPAQPLPDLRLVRLGSEPVLAADFDLFLRGFARGSKLVHGYGSTETAYLSRGILDHTTCIEGALVPLGGPPEGVEISIVDESLRPLPDGEVGEILARVQYAPTGYWNVPEQSADKFRQDPDDPTWVFLRTGDLGMVGMDGNLYHLGRRDSMVKIRGFRVELAEVENRLRQHPGVRMAAVHAHTQQGVASLAAYIVPQGDPPPSAADLRRGLAASLPDFMIPAAFVFMESLPLLPNGKLNPNALPAPGQVRPPSAEPIGDAERKIARLFAEVLAAEVGREDHFFDLGGDSLRALRLVARVNEVFGSLLTAAAIYAHPTVRALAEYLEAGQPILSGLVALNPYGERAPLICVPGQNGNAMHFRQLVSELGHEYPVYSFQHPRYDPRSPRYDTVEALAAHYVDLMQAAVPSGPFLLVGASVGGAIVFEMAQQLAVAGRLPLGVVMIDSHFSAPGFSIAAQTAQRLKAVREKEKSEPLLMRMRKEVYRLRRRLAKALAKAAPMTAEEQALRRVKQETERMAERYRPQTYQGRVVYLTCREDRRQAQMPEPGFDELWRRVVAGGFEVIDIPGGHLDSLEMPNVRTVARRLRQVMAGQVSPSAVGEDPPRQ
ncbi:MAG: alpha/beta fold hydrolase [Chloroflexi bacterium]|nr:alpha/beta fold hydrolase [Chloroflexota bacterium]